MLTADQARKIRSDALEKKRADRAKRLELALITGLPSWILKIEGMIRDRAAQERDDIIVDLEKDEIITIDLEFIQEIAPKIITHFMGRGFVTEWPLRVEFAPSTNYARIRLAWPEPRFRP